jgi:hypothetical protein
MKFTTSLTLEITYEFVHVNKITQLTADASETLWLGHAYIYWLNKRTSLYIKYADN